MFELYNLMLQFGKVIKLKPLLLLYLCSAFSLASVMYANISTSSTLASTTAQHFLTVTFQNYTIPSSSYLFLNFTSGWDVSLATKASSGDFCENDCIPTSVNIQKIGGSNIKISNLFPTQLTNAYISIGISIKNIVNPPQTKTDSISLQIFNSAPSQIGSTTIAMTIDPGIMTCTGTPSTSTLVGATSSYLFTITPNSNITLPDTGSLVMAFPSNWSDSSAGPVFSYSGCSNTTTSIICNVLANSVTVDGNELFSTANAPASFSFTFKDIINPGTQRPNNQLNLQYVLSNGTVASTCSVTISGLTIPQIPTLSFAITDKLANLSFTNAMPAMLTDQLAITFPNQVYLGDVKLIMQRTNASVTQEVVPTIKVNGLNQLILYPFFSTQIQQYQIILQNIYVSYPIQTNPITFTIQRNGFPYSTSTCCSITFPPSETMTASTSMSPKMVKSTANYEFTFNLTYYSLNYFLIDFCSSFTLTPAQTYTCYISLVLTNNLINCVAVTNNQLKVSLTNGSTFSNVFSYESNYTLVVIGITNPSVVSCDAAFSTYSAPSNKLEYSNTMTITYNQTKIIQSSLTLSNPIVGAFSDYTFKVNNTNVLSVNSFLVIYFPSLFSINGLNCLFNGAVVTYNIVNSTTIKITIPNAMGQNGLANIPFTVVQVKNLYSLRPSPSFKLQLQNNAGLVIQSTDDGVYAKLSTLATFSSLTSAYLSTVAGQAGSFTINFSHNLTIPSTTSINLTVSFPSSYFLNTCTSCSSIQTFTITNTTTSVTISQIFNPQAITQSNPVVVSLYVDGFLSIQDNLANPTFTATPIAYTVLSNSSYLGQPVTVNITIQQLPISTHYLIITIPSEYTISTLSIYSLSLTQTHPVITNPINFTITKIFIANVTISIEGLTNPTSTPSSVWVLNAYDSNNILMGTGSSSNQFTAVCGTNCKQCVNPSFCLSCYNNSLVNSLTLLDFSTKTCVSSPCGSGTFQKGSVCYPCNNCLTCSVFESNCTSCGSPKLLFNQTCLANCPDGYYSDGISCLTCLNNCQTCNSVAFCFTCASGFVLQTDNSCKSNCPATSYNYSNECISCPTNCTTCNQYGCLTCSSPNYLCQISSVVCVSTCPQNFYISANNSWCQACGSSCLTCQNTSANCTSCNTATTNKYFSSNKCLPACPSATYADQLYQCKTCVFPCLECYTATNCSSCQPTYYLYALSGLCSQTCVSNTIIDGSNCVQCVSPCLTCSGTVNTCKSCISSYFLNRATSDCSTTCSSPKKAYNGVCDICLTPCIACDATNTSKCTSCQSGYYLYANTCFSSCPNHTFSDSTSTCAACTPPCASCAGSAATCTGCYYGNYLYNNNCQPACPVNYYPYLGSCSLCFAQCNGCITGGEANQCQACNSPNTIYYNPFTYQCTSNCSYPYYPTSTTPLKCLPCELPCKTCSSYYTICSSCYNGYFLLNQQCFPSCPSNYYSDSTNNICVGCPSLCATCTSLMCSTCSSGNYYFAGACYSTCPTHAPYIYGNYCRNCLTDSCLMCNSQGACTLCASSTYNYNGACVSSCPENYELDRLTTSRCVLIASSSYSNYVQYLQVMKILVVPGSALWLALLFFIPFAQVKLFGVAVLFALPQSIALSQFIVMYLRQQSKLNMKLLALPQWLAWAVISLHAVITFFHTLFLHKNRFTSGKEVDDWLAYGSNKYRYRIIVFFSLINKQVSYLLFSGFFNIPVTTLSFMSALPRSFYITHILYMIFQLLLILIAALICILKQTVAYNYKLFFSSVDLFAIFSVSLVFDFVFLLLANKQVKPTPYQKYILPNVSNNTLPALSDPAEEVAQETNPNNVLHRSASDEDMFQSKQMKDIDFKSVIDNNDYFDQTPFIENDQIEDGIENGKFRKKNKKKRGRRREGNLNVIDQQSELQSQEEQKMDKKKPKGRRMKVQNVGGLKNFIYWKKPKQKKKSPMKKFKENEVTIMSRIKEKESEFDTITQNDIIFQEDELENSSDQGYDIQNQSRRALYKPKVPSYYDNLFNLNYAEKHHLK